MDSKLQITIKKMELLKTCESFLSFTEYQNLVFQISTIITNITNPQIEDKQFEEIIYNMIDIFDRYYIDVEIEEIECLVRILIYEYFEFNFEKE